MKKLIFISILVILSSCNFAYGQTQPRPDDLVCISQSDANLCASRALEAAALREENAELKRAREADKISMEELKNRINQLTVELARTNGQLTEAEKNQAAQRAIIEYLLPRTRKKCFPLSICF